MEEFSGLDGARVLVTGGAGFIGSHICEAMLAGGAHVICFDNLSNSSGENITHLENRQRFEIFNGDIRDAAACLEASRDCTHISHQAGMVSVPLSFDEPELCMQINVEGSSNLFSAALEHGVKRVVYASSAACYGDDAAELKVEDRIGEMLSPYAESKLQMELLARNMHRSGRTEFCGLRYFNVYGPRQDPRGAYASIIPALITKLLKAEQPIIFGDGEQTRDFIHVKDVARANVLAMLAPSIDVGCICNIASGNPTSINELFDMTKDSLQERSTAIAVVGKSYQPERKGDIKHSLANVNRAEQQLGFRSEIGIGDGLRDAISWYSNDLN